MGSGRLQTGMALTRRQPARGPTDGSIPSLDAERTVYLEPTWKPHTSYRLLLERPPQGYRFVAAGGGREALVRAASRFRAAYTALYTLDRLVPAHLLKSALDMARRPPAGTVLTYAVNHLVLRREPWVLDLPGEHVTNTIGGYRHFRRFGGVVRRALLSPRCRGIVVNTEAGRRALTATLGSEVAAKVTVVPWAVEPKSFAKADAADGPVRMLFVDSANIPGQYRYKGGPEALAAFDALRDRYPHLELVVRSSLPPLVRQRYTGTPGLRLIEDVIPWRELEQAFMTADIFLLPTHFTPLTVFLDAMSYELPVVTTDAWANPEIVEDGVTGLLVHDSPVAHHRERMLPRYFVPPAGSPEYRDILASTNRQLVRELVEKLSILIENADLRRKLGRAGREAVENGRFSIQQRNSTLKCALDEAINPAEGKGASAT